MNRKTNQPAPNVSLLAALTDTALIDAGGPTIFARGKAYAQTGAVEIVDQDPLPEPAIRGQVQGSELYETEIWLEDNTIAGDCDCPHAANGYFCKHQVALALVWREHLGESPSVQKKARAKQPSLNDFLHAQTVGDLAGKLLALADRNRDIARELKQWQKLSNLRGGPAELKAVVTDILDTGRDFIEYGESAAYISRAEAVLPLLQKTCQNTPQSAVALTIHALHCVWQALAQADDSDGEIGDLCCKIGAIFLQALDASGPQAAHFGQTYLQLVLDDPFGSFDSNSAEVLMGEEALASFRQNLAEQWRSAKDAFNAKREVAKSLRQGRHSFDMYDSHLMQLECLHLEQLENNGEIDAAIFVLREEATDASGCASLIRLLDRHGRQREAFAEAVAATEAHPNDWQIENMLLEFFQRDGLHREALALRQKQFARQPCLRAYQAVLSAAKATGEDIESLRQTMLDNLAMREQAALKDPHAVLFTNSAGKAGPYVTLRAEILASEERWLEACDLIQEPALCEASILRRIAIHLPSSHRNEAVALLKRVFQHSMRTTNSSYQEPLALVKEILARLEDTARQSWLAELRSTFKAKRNFMRDLPAE